MLISCKYCMSIHERSFACPMKPKSHGKKENNNITKFRNTSAWKKKRTEIKKRDLYLCQYCKLNGRYTFDGLDVHHIRPISEHWHGRLNNNNLITLCKYHHMQADKGEIYASVLVDIINTVNRNNITVSVELK